MPEWDLCWSILIWQMGPLTWAALFPAIAPQAAEFYSELSKQAVGQAAVKEEKKGESSRWDRTAVQRSTSTFARSISIPPVSIPGVRPLSRLRHRK